MVLMKSTYQVQATSYADLSLPVHARIDDLHRQARSLAPAVEASAADSSCTDLRPTGPRQAKAWDLVAEALGWNLIADHAELVAAADAFEEAGIDYTVGYDSNAGTRYWVRPVEGDEVAVTDRLWQAAAAYEAQGISWTTSGGKIWPSGSSYNAVCDDCVAAVAHTHDAPKDEPFCFLCNAPIVRVEGVWVHNDPANPVLDLNHDPEPVLDYEDRPQPAPQVSLAEHSDEGDDDIDEVEADVPGVCVECGQPAGDWGTLGGRPYCSTCGEDFLAEAGADEEPF
jgi:hypothetical protein